MDLCNNKFVIIFVLFFDVLFEFLKNVLGLRRRCESKARLDDKIVVITGANSGIGKETTYQLSLRGAKIIMGCRDMKKAENVVKDIKQRNPDANLIVVKLDLSSLASVRQFAKTVSEQESRIDILVNNAGIAFCPEWQTEDGFEMQFGTNHLGHFLLTLCLLPLLKKSTNARIVNLSAKLYALADINFENINLRNGAYSPLYGYCHSKLANILFTRELAKRLAPNSNVKAYSLHPGIFKSELDRHQSQGSTFLMKYLGISLELGAQTTLYCALEESIENESGSYYDDCKRVDKMLPKATDDRTAEKLWELSSDLVKLEKHLRI